MLGKRMKHMLDVANTLTAEDLDRIRSSAPVAIVEEDGQLAADEVVRSQPPVGHELNDEPMSRQSNPPDTVAQTRSAGAATRTHRTFGSGVTRGERERRRTRESKVSTECVGAERPKHTWWPVGTELIGRIGPESFSAQVVENPQVKSGRSLLITSGAAQGRVCLTPTRAALEATEDYRNSRNLGRSGGVTNGWTFWRPKAT